MNMSDKEHDFLLNHARIVSRAHGIDKTLKDFSVDVIIAPADSAFNLLVSAAGMVMQKETQHNICLLF